MNSFILMFSLRHKDFQTIDMNYESRLNIINLDSSWVLKTHINSSLTVYSAKIFSSSDQHDI